MYAESYADLSTEKAKKRLDEVIKEWRSFTDLMEYRLRFGGDVEDRWRVDGRLVGTISGLQKRLGGEHRDLNDVHNEWIKEAGKKYDALKAEGNKEGEVKK
ncbi:hypothetical protein JX266_009433 [Neoarthrinium moseri]|uniref:uncharacterized protein n=1 Tax=Neoarthrinium moseri TaxID=1658444 RepID=UPI001FDB187F|nr:uncharacterized protein JN550_010472 [Neoarthrinium moseri]KAI1844339.1 hypothetical protein JX266_009433 [Neoarthrinium moseri]KAI1862169.1 hypothetical protein JN550_010472 [Neoarthrinium moseri]